MRRQEARWLRMRRASVIGLGRVRVGVFFERVVSQAWMSPWQRTFLGPHVNKLDPGDILIVCSDGAIFVYLIYITVQPEMA